MSDDAQIAWLEDGAPYSRRFGDRYFSRAGGRAEKREVFLRGNGLPARWAGRREFGVAELGFGAGLNFLETLALWRKAAPPGAHLAYAAFELYPLSGAEMARALAPWKELEELAAGLPGQWPPAPGRKMVFGNVTLELVTGDARVQVPRWRGMADCWYFDGFSPAKNPQMWEEGLLRAAFARTSPGGTFSTYSAAGLVRRNLQKAGFVVRRVAGFGGKRERLEGERPISGRAISSGIGCDTD
jgi:tRNA U34 5-methylaminomethyl-2-thiouridine-forming methyltransferase MnmC